LIILSPRPSDEELLEVTKAGATAYLNKSSSAEELVRTVRKVCRGEYPINDTVISKPELAKIILKQFQDTLSLGKNMQTVAAPLTKREVEVLNLVSEGNSNKQVASILDTSEQTIKNYVSSILRKLNANDRTHAVVLAIRQGIIS
jgi:DNA-binding NarL/FixJ family response regulator